MIVGVTYTNRFCFRFDLKISKVHRLVIFDCASSLAAHGFCVSVCEYRDLGTQL